MLLTLQIYNTSITLDNQGPGRGRSNSGYKTTATQEPLDSLLMTTNTLTTSYSDNSMMSNLNMFSAITGNSNLPTHYASRREQRKMKQFVPNPERSDAEIEVIKVEKAIGEMSTEIRDIEKELIKIADREKELDIRRQDLEICDKNEDHIQRGSWWQLTYVKTYKKIKGITEESIWISQKEINKEKKALEDKKKFIRGWQSYFRGLKVEACLKIQSHPNRKTMLFWPADTIFKTLTEDPINGNCGARNCEVKCGHNEANRTKNPRNGCGREDCVMHCLECLDDTKEELDRLRLY